MRTTSLFTACVLCLAASGCGTTSNEPQGQPESRTSDYGYITGSRLPSGSSSVQGTSKEGWEDDRRNTPTHSGTWR
jgi:hypothetical protein